MDSTIVKKDKDEISVYHSVTSFSFLLFFLMIFSVDNDEKDEDVRLTMKF